MQQFKASTQRQKTQRLLLLTLLVPPNQTSAWLRRLWGVLRTPLKKRPVTGRFSFLFALVLEPSSEMLASKLNLLIQFACFHGQLDDFQCFD